MPFTSSLSISSKNLSKTTSKSKKVSCVTSNQLKTVNLVTFLNLALICCTLSNCFKWCQILYQIVLSGVTISADPEVVIGLYPHLLPSDRRRMLNQAQPTRPPTLSGEHLEEGMKHLITYLTQVVTVTPSHPHQTPTLTLSEAVNREAEFSESAEKRTTTFRG